VTSTINVAQRPRSSSPSERAKALSVLRQRPPTGAYKGDLPPDPVAVKAEQRRRAEERQYTAMIRLTARELPAPRTRPATGF
jgi:hypothetical protein